MKRKLLFVLAALAMLSASAAEETNAVFVHTKAGDAVAYLFSAQPKVTYEGTDMVIVGEGIDVVYSLTDVAKVDFGAYEEPTGVTEAEVKDTKVSVICSGESVQVNGLEAGSVAAVYNLAGQMISKAQAGVDGSASLNVPSGSNLYIVKTNKVSFKIVKK